MKSQGSMQAMLRPQAPMVPSVYASLQNTQREALKTMGLPTRHQERWKYANLSFLSSSTFAAAQTPSSASIQSSLRSLRESVGQDARFVVMVNGAWQKDYSDALPTGCQLESLDDLMSREALPTTAMNPELYPFAALNQADLSTGLGLHVGANTDAGSLVLVSFVDASQACFVQPTVFMNVEAGARLNVLEIPVALGDASIVMNQMVTLMLGANAECHWVKSQALPLTATLFAHTNVEQAEHSRMHYTNITLGARVSRDEVLIDLQGPGAAAKTSGFTALKHDQQWADNHIEICHASPHTDSEMLYKGTLDAASTAVFNGRLWVKPQAQKITAYQANHTLLLSDAAEMYSKPELEIYADDVKCKHGATTGKMDEEGLFYLQSRGIEKHAARALLIAGFRNDVMDTIHNDAVRHFVSLQMEQA